MFLLQYSYAQMAVHLNKQDSTLARNYLLKADSLFYGSKLGDASIYYIKSATLYKNYGNWHECIDAYLKAAKSYNWAYETDSSFYYYNIALELAKQNQLGNYLLIAKIYLNIGDVYGKFSKENLSIANYMFALNQIKGHESKDSLYINTKTEIFLSIGKTYVTVLDYDKALENYFSALKILKSSTDPNIYNTFRVYLNIAITYGRCNEVQEELEYYNKAKSLITKGIQFYTDYMFLINSNIGAAYESIKDYNNAYYYYKIAHEIAYTYYDEFSIHTGFASNDLGNIQGILGDYNSSIKNLTISLEIRKNVYNETNALTANTFKNLSIVYQKSNKLSEALNYSLTSIMIEKELFGKNHFNLTDNYYQTESFILIVLIIKKLLIISKNRLHLIQHFLMIQLF